MTPLILLPIAVLLGGGIASVIGGRARWTHRAGAWSIVAGSLLGLVPAIAVLAGAGPIRFAAAWAIPVGSFSIALDPLAAFFLVPILVVSAVCAAHGARALDVRERTPGFHWLAFAALVAGMILVTIAHDAILFLIAWEVMSIAGYFVVTWRDDEEEVRRAGWTYLVASHLGAAFLVLFFVMLGATAGSFDFDVIRGAPAVAGIAGGLFLLALVGFGTKAAFVPLHAWLPETYAAAPPHVTAVMSGAMIDAGVYGLMRSLSLLGEPQRFWGPLLVGVGALSAILGILFALGQRDLKRVLGYSSVENMGIVAMGLGLGVTALHAHSSTVAAAAFAGVMLHVLDHSFFKALLFLSAGAIEGATGTRDLEKLGGILKRMPRTGALFLVGVAAIAALPPLNGFAGEFVLYSAAGDAMIHDAAGPAIAAMVVIGALALTGGLVAACFAKLAGITLLGQPRSAIPAAAADPAPAALGPMALLAAGCVAIGLFSPLLLGPLSRAAEPLSGAVEVSAPLAPVVAVSAVLIALLGGLALLRRRLLARRTVGAGPTWGCGYAAPTARMQYSGSSFSQPITEMFRNALGTRETIRRPQGLFPADASLAIETPDVSRERIFRPVFGGVGAGLSRMRWLQSGNLQLYVLYIAATVVVLLVWKVG